MKTCEEYVLNRLETLENEQEQYQEKIDNLTDMVASLSSTLALVKKIAEVRKSSSGSTYINFDSVWEEYDKELYSKLVDALALEMKGSE